jgi:sigma-E factor negative regulatory protein RseC
LKIENLAFFGEKRSFLTKMFARTCVYEKDFVPLQSHFALMDELIRHTGVIMSTSDRVAHVQIVQTSACSACKAKSMCMSAESQAKEMDVIMLEPMQVGDKVEVEVRERLAWKAVLLAYILPFIVMMGLIAVLDFATEWSEAVIGTLSLCGIALYYIGLSFFKDRLQKQFTFTARKL